MKIETKYSIGDKVWYMKNNFPLLTRVVRIQVDQIDYRDRLIGIRYRVGILGLEHSESPIPESKIFKTKQELLDSL